MMLIWIQKTPIIEYFNKLLVHITCDFAKFCLDLYSYIFKIPNIVFNSSYYFKIFWSFILLGFILAVSKAVFFRFHSSYQRSFNISKKRFTNVVKVLSLFFLMLIVCLHTPFMRLSFKAGSIKFNNSIKILQEHFLGYRNNPSMQIGYSLVYSIILLITALLVTYILLKIIGLMVSIIIIIALAPFIIIDLVRSESTGVKSYLATLYTLIFEYIVSILTVYSAILIICSISLKLVVNTQTLLFLLFFISLILAIFIHIFYKYWGITHKYFYHYLQTVLWEKSPCI